MTDDELSAILKIWQVVPAPPSLEARVLGSRPRLALSPWRWTAGAVAAAAMIGLGAWILYDRHPAEVPAHQRSQPNAAEMKKDAIPPPVVSMPGRERELGVPPIRIDAKAAASRLLNSPPLIYPKAAKEAGIQGTVRLQIVIGKDGHVMEAMVISGDPLLAPAAVQVVNGQLYRPTLLNGQPIELVTEVEFNFKPL